ncbi:MAG: hypothetical protein HKN14_15170 [Marinicaulis sp.]|nr:hypothetical protein [Marinicaulis sp.]
MQRINAHDVKQRFGAAIRKAKTAPVAIIRYNCIAPVMISAEEYQRYQTIVEHRLRRDVSHLLYLMEETGDAAEYHRTARKLRRRLNDDATSTAKHLSQLDALFSLAKSHFRPRPPNQPEQEHR